MQRGNLDDLLAFLAVGRERSFTKAAAKLGMSQSSLSHTIRELEARLGVRLLTRTTRSVAPTQAGERLLQNIGPRFEEIDAELAAVRDLRDKPAGTIRITATEYAADAILLPKLAKLLPAVSGYQDRDRCRLRPEQYRRGRLRRRCAQRRAGRQGHDRGAHRAGPAHGRRRCAVVFSETARAEEAAGPDRSQLHQSATSHAWRAVFVGIRKRRPRAEGARRRPDDLQRRRPDAQCRARRTTASPTFPKAWSSRILPRAASSGCWGTGASRIRATTSFTQAVASPQRPSPCWSMLRHRAC